MRPRTIRRTFLLAAALLALAGSALAPSEARASCGDGLQSLHDGQAMPDSNVSGRPFRHTDKPCNGLACKRGSVPLVPAVPPVPPTIEDWSCLPALLSLMEPIPGVRLIDLCSDLPARLARDIFHPPRVHSLMRLA